MAKALEAAELVDVLKGEGPFTVSAPTDEAFEKLPPGTVEALLEDKEKLTAILTYHAVPRELKAKDVVETRSVRTVQCQQLTINVSSEAV